jgi:hypothetical protein
MTIEQKKAKILGAVASRGWVTAEIYWDAGKALRDEGKVKMDERFTLGGNRRNVWVAA